MTVKGLKGKDKQAGLHILIRQVTRAQFQNFIVLCYKEYIELEIMLMISCYTMSAKCNEIHCTTVSHTCRTVDQTMFQLWLSLTQDPPVFRFAVSMGTARDIRHVSFLGSHQTPNTTTVTQTQCPTLKPQQRYSSPYLQWAHLACPSSHNAHLSPCLIYRDFLCHTLTTTLDACCISVALVDLPCCA